MDYHRQANDLGYRRINLKRTALIPDFTKFTASAQIINYTEDYVLEIQKEDGSCHCVYEGRRKSFSYLISGNYCCIDPDCPLDHLWLQVGDSPVQYKLPNELPVDTNGKHWFKYLSGGATAKLIGDKYFNMAYDLTRIAAN